MSNNITATISNGIWQMAEKASQLQTPSFDTTVVGVIKAIDKNNPNKYRVQIGSMACDAKVINDKSYYVGATVYITVVGGDYSKEKIIIGSVDPEKGVEPEVYKPFSNLYDLSDWKTYPSSEDENKDLLTIQTTSDGTPTFSESSCIFDTTIDPRADYFAMQLAFTTEDLNTFNGEYSVRVELAADEEVLATFSVSSKELYGNPYFTTNDFKYAIVKGGLNEFIEKARVNKIRLTLGEDGKFDTAGKLIKLTYFSYAFGKDKSQFSESSLYLTMTPEGSDFKEEGEDVVNKSLKIDVNIYADLVINKSADLFYIFKGTKDDTIKEGIKWLEENGDNSQSYSFSLYRNIGKGWEYTNQTKSLTQTQGNPLHFTESISYSDGNVKYKIVLNRSPYLESDIVEFTNLSLLNSAEEALDLGTKNSQDINSLQGSVQNNTEEINSAKEEIQKIQDIQANINAQIANVQMPLVLTCNDTDNPKGIYNLYGSDYQLLNYSDCRIIRTINVKPQDEKNLLPGIIEGGLLYEEWLFPAEDGPTMITSVDANNNRSGYRIKNFLNVNSLDNTIRYTIWEKPSASAEPDMSKDKLYAYGEIRLTFGLATLNGSSSRLVVQPGKTGWVYRRRMDAAGTNQLTAISPSFQVLLYNSEDTKAEPEDVTLKCQYFTLDGVQITDAIVNNSFKLQSYCNGVKIVYSNLNLNLETYYLIPQISTYFTSTINSVIEQIMVENVDIFMSGPSRVIYDYAGENPQYLNEPYKLSWSRAENTHPNFNGEWKLYIYDKATKQYIETNENSLIQLKGNKLLPPIALNKDPIYGYVEYTEKNNNNNLLLQWRHPIICERNIYSFDLLNKWDGRMVIDNESNTIFAKTLGVGEKDNNNTFTGMLMGAIGKNAQNTTYGLYGYSKSAKRFSLTENGDFYVGDGANNYLDFSNGSFKLVTSQLNVNTNNFKIDTTQPGNAAATIFSIGAPGSEILKVTRDSVYLAGWNVRNDRIYYESYAWPSMLLSPKGVYLDYMFQNEKIYARPWVFTSGSRFGITNLGDLYCSNAILSGNLKIQANSNDNKVYAYMSSSVETVGLTTSEDGKVEIGPKEGVGIGLRTQEAQAFYTTVLEPGKITEDGYFAPALSSVINSALSFKTLVSGKPFVYLLQCGPMMPPAAETGIQKYELILQAGGIVSKDQDGDIHPIDVASINLSYSFNSSKKASIELKADNFIFSARDKDSTPKSVTFTLTQIAALQKLVANN